MRRRLLSNISEAIPQDLHLTLTYIFLISAWFLATMTVFFSLCLSRYRIWRNNNKQKLKGTAGDANNLAETTTTTPAEPNSTGATDPEEIKETSWIDGDEFGAKPVFQAESDRHQGRESPPKPSLGGSFARVSKSASKKLLSASMSMKLPEKMKLPDRLSRIGTSVKRERRGKSDGDPIWMKTIILGERCRVPGRGGDGDQDEEEAVAIYDEKGNRHQSYRARTPRSLPVSRSNSFASVQ